MNGARPCSVGSIHTPRRSPRGVEDRKSTRLNSSHGSISYAGFCLEKQLKMHIFDFIHPNCGEAAKERFGERSDGTVPMGHSDIFLMIRRPPRSTLFPSRRSSD